MEFQDKTLNCVDCGDRLHLDGRRAALLRRQELQERAEALQGLQGQARGAPAGAGGVGRERVETTTNCSACGKETTVPFRPTQGRPVFCRECFQSRKFAGAGGV